MTTETEFTILARLHYESDRMRGLIASGLALVTQALDKGRNPYIAFSGGKDSLAVMGLVLTVRPDVRLVWSDDELEYPETVEYMTTVQRLAGDQLTITLGHVQHAGWFSPWADAPYWREPLPGSVRIEEPIEGWMVSGGYELAFTGLRRNENKHRRAWLATAGPLYRAHTDAGMTWRSCPIHDWTEDDVWAYIVGRGLPYNRAYDVMEAARIPRRRQRVGPMCLTPRTIMEQCWPDELTRLEARYRRRWG